jgi:hypothetical protein
MFHVCTCTFFADTICLLTNRKMIDLHWYMTACHCFLRLYSKTSLTLKEWRFNLSFPWLSMLFLNSWRVRSHIVRYDTNPPAIQKHHWHSREAQIERPLFEYEWAFRVQALVFNIWVSHALEMTIHFYYPNLVLFLFTQPFTHSKSCLPNHFLFGATPVVNNREFGNLERQRQRQRGKYNCLYCCIWAKVYVTTLN